MNFFAFPKALTLIKGGCAGNVIQNKGFVLLPKLRVVSETSDGEPVHAYPTFVTSRRYPPYHGKRLSLWDVFRLRQHQSTEILNNGNTFRRCGSAGKLCLRRHQIGQRRWNPWNFKSFRPSPECWAESEGIRRLRLRSQEHTADFQNKGRKTANCGKRLVPYPPRIQA